MEKIPYRKKRAALWPALMLVLMVFASGCPRVEPGPPAVEEVLDADGLISRISERGAQVERMDANLEVKVTGVEGPFVGKLYGTIQFERSSSGSLKMWIQTYSIVGAPVFEMITDGRRVEIFSPLENTVFVNFTDYAAPGEAEEFPLSSFSEVSLPLQLMVEQLALIFGIGFDPSRRYQLGARDDQYILSEWSGQSLDREMYFIRAGLLLTQVRVFQGEAVIGGMICGKHGDASTPGGFVPGLIEFSQGGARMRLTLSNTRTNDQVTGPAIDFRHPGEARIILLTPPVR